MLPLMAKYPSVVLDKFIIRGGTLIREPFQDLKQARKG